MNNKTQRHKDHKVKENDKGKDKERANILSSKIISAAIEVHRTLGPGLLESAYKKFLCQKLFLRKIPFKRQVQLPINYKGLELDCAYKIDILVQDLVIVELKTVEELHPIYKVHLLTYLRLKELWLGLLINFNQAILKDGIKRIVN